MNKQELKSLLENIYTALTEDKTGLWTDWHPPLGDWLAPVDHFPIPYALPPTIRRAKITPIWQSPLRPRIKPTSVGPLKRYRPTLTWGPDDPSPDELRLFDHWLKDPDWNNMNKQDLKSLLENIYTTLTEDDWYNDKHFNDSPLPPYGPPPPPPPPPPKPVYPPWPTDFQDELSRLRGLLIDDYDGWLEEMERDPKWWSDRYGFDVLEWWRTQDPNYRGGSGGTVG